MEFAFAILSGFSLGCLHAFDADHVAAVSAFASKQPSAKKASLFGIFWGLGHSSTLIVLGLVALGLKIAIPASVQSYAETAVGAMLVFIGMWSLREAVRTRHAHVHRHEHDGYEHAHMHSHHKSEEHGHRHSMFFVGAAHGVAGTASVLVIVPVTLAQSVLGAFSYLVFFSVGTMAAMGMFAYLLGAATERVGLRSIAFVHGFAALLSLSVGTFWLWRSLEVA